MVNAGDKDGGMSELNKVIVIQQPHSGVGICHG